MSDSKGPKIDLPEELAAELDHVPSAPRVDEEQPGPSSARPKPEAPSDGGARPEAAERAAGEAPQEEVERLRSERDDLKDRYLRLAAEFENFKRRVLKEHQDLLNYATESLIKDLLETVDNLERALEHARTPEDALDSKTLLEGVELTLRGLMRVLERTGVKVVPATGEKFDPSLHEAVGQVEARDHPPGQVVEVHQKGYLLKDRLLRPALVGVSRRGDEESS